MKKVWDYLWPVLLCVGVGVTAGFFQRSAIEEWYPLLHKPSITPPAIVFPIVWSILYVFSWRSPLLGLLDILLLDFLVVFYICKAYVPSRISSWLFIPYILWLLLATYLNVYICFYNP